MNTVRLAYISGGFPIWPLVVARERDLFARAHIAIELTHTGSSVAQMQGLREGRFDVGLQLPDHVVRASLSGLPMQILAAQTHAPDVALIARPDVSALTALRGQPIAVDGARSGYALLLRRLLLREGLGEGDIVLTEVGDSASRVQALESGAVAAAFINPPLDRALVANNFVRLTSTREAFPDYPGPVMAAARSWIDGHRDTARALQGVWRDAWAWLTDPAHDDAAIALAVRELQADAAAAARALGALRAAGIPKIDQAGLRIVIDLVAPEASALLARSDSLLV